jgi:hypothetical protein
MDDVVCSLQTLDTLIIDDWSEQFLVGKTIFLYMQLVL